MKIPGFLGCGSKSEAQLITAGELLVCECNGLKQKFVVVEKPQPLTGGPAADSRVNVARVRDEQNQMSRVSIDDAHEFQVLLFSNPPSFLQRWLNLFLEARSPLLWGINARGVVCDGPWKGWEVVIGEPWTGRISSKRRLSGDALSQFYFDLTQGLFALHELGLPHGALGVESIVAVGTPPIWKLLPPLQRNPSTELDDVRSFGRLLHRHVLGTETPNDPLAVDAFPPHISNSWKTIFRGCLHPDPDQRWSAGHAIFGSQPLPIPDRLIMQTQGENRIVSWDHPQQIDAEVETALYELRPDAGAPMGSVHGANRLEYTGSPVSGFDNPVQIHRPVHGRRFQVVSTVKGYRSPLVVFGPMVVLSSLPEVELQDVKFRDGRLHALWQWPELASAVLICVRSDRYAAIPDEAERFWRVGRGQHQRSAWHSWSMDGRHYQQLFVTAFAVEETTPENRTSSGASATCRWNGPGYRHRVDYALVQPLNKQKTVRMQLESRAMMEVELPRLVLGACRNHAPKRLTDADYKAPLPEPLSLSPGRTREVAIRCDRFPDHPALRGRLFVETGKAPEWLDLECNPPSGLSLS